MVRLLIYFLAGREWKVLSQSLKVKRKEVKETIQKFAQSNQQMSHKAAAVPGVLEATQATEVSVCHLGVCAIYFLLL